MSTRRTSSLCLLRRPERKRAQGVGCAWRSHRIAHNSLLGRQRIARSCECPFIAAAAAPQTVPHVHSGGGTTALERWVDRPIALRCRVQGNATPRRERRRVLGGLHGRRPARGRREDVPLRAAYAPLSVEHACVAHGRCSLSAQSQYVKGCGGAAGAAADGAAMGDPGTPAQAADAEAPAGERRLKLKPQCCNVLCLSIRSTPVLRPPVREYSEYPLCCALPCARLRRAG